MTNSVMICTLHTIKSEYQINDNIRKECSTHDKGKCIQKLNHTIRWAPWKEYPKSNNKTVMNKVVQIWPGLI